MHFHRGVITSLVLLGAALFLAGCNPATRGWSSAKGESVSFGRLSSAKQNCNYPQARRRAVHLLRKTDNRAQNEQRAARVMGNAEQCMRRYGVNYRAQRAYGLGRRK